MSQEKGHGSGRTDGAADRQNEDAETYRQAGRKASADAGKAWPDGRARSGKRKEVPQHHAIPIEWPKGGSEEGTKAQRQMLDAWWDAALKQARQYKVNAYVLTGLYRSIMKSDGTTWASDSSIAEKAGDCSIETVKRELSACKRLGIFVTESGWRKSRSRRNKGMVKTRIIRLTMPGVLLPDDKMMQWAMAVAIAKLAKRQSSDDKMSVTGGPAKRHRSKTGQGHTVDPQTGVTGGPITPDAPLTASDGNSGPEPEGRPQAVPSSRGSDASSSTIKAGMSSSTVKVVAATQPDAPDGAGCDNTLREEENMRKVGGYIDVSGIGRCKIESFKNPTTIRVIDPNGVNRPVRIPLDGKPPYDITESAYDAST